MSSIINGLNRFFTGFFDLILAPFGALSPIWGLVFISFISGILLIYIYGLVSNQRAIRAVKRKIHANLLEVILYRHDLALCLKAQGRMLLGGAHYFLLAVPPLIILIIPCLFILSQLNLRYETRPLKLKEPLIVKAAVTDDAGLMNVTIGEMRGLDITEPVRIQEKNEVAWRIRPSEMSDYKISVKTDRGTLESPVFVGAYRGPIFANNFSAWYMNLLYPSRQTEDLKRLGFSAFLMDYPKEEHALFGIRLHWILIFFIVSLVSGLLASRVLNIEI